MQRPVQVAFDDDEYSSCRDEHQSQQARPYSKEEAVAAPVCCRRLLPVEVEVASGRKNTLP